MKCKFIVGKVEKHEVEVDTGGAWFWSAKKPCFEIAIDGKTVMSKRKYFKSTDKYRTRIGDKEKHDLEIIVRYPGLGWGGVKIEAFVDGKPHSKKQEPLF